MTRENEKSFVAQIAEAYQALEERPGLHATISGLEAEIICYCDQIMNLEINAINRKDEIERLNAKIRSLEVERSDAFFRTLEAEDKLSGVLRTLRGIQSETASLVEVIDPSPRDPNSGQFVKAISQNDIIDEYVESVANDLSPDDMRRAHADALRTHEPVDTYGWEAGLIPFVPTPIDTPLTPSDAVSTTSTEGQSEVPLPVITATADLSGSVQNVVINGDNVSTIDGVSVSPSPIESSASKISDPSAPGALQPMENVPSKGPYSGKRYWEHPLYVHRTDWYAGGGTPETYDWRPDNSLTA